MMRCLSVARAFENKGENLLFVTADHKGDSLINQQGFQTVCLDSEWSDPKNEKIDSVIEKYHPDLILVDSYFVTEQYMENLSKKVCTAYFDDLNAHCWKVNYIINYNIFASVFDYSSYVGTSTKLLLNPQYAPMRDEFKNCSAHKIKDVTDILFSAGGSDPERVTEKVLSAICPKMPGVRFHLIVGALNPRLGEIKMLSDNLENVALHINERHMSDLMNTCDVAVAAAGMTLYELCATGLPTLTYTLADNQLVAAEQFNKQGIMLSAGDCRGDDGFINRLATQLSKLVGDVELRSVLSEKMQKLVDGEGAERITGELLSHFGETTD